MFDKCLFLYYIAPDASFIDELTNLSVYVQGDDKTLKFEGFLGCFPTEIEIKKDGAVIPFENVIVYDKVNAKIAKIEWELKPIDKAKHDKEKFSAEVKFRRESGILQKYYKEAIIEVLNSKYHFQL